MVNREFTDVEVLVSFYAAQDDSSISSEPLPMDKFSVPISNRSQDLSEFKKVCYI